MPGYAPKHGSWPNTAEAGIALLSRQALDQHLPDPDTVRLFGQTVIPALADA